eukprot:802535-Rhodomonas_salina.1
MAETVGSACTLCSIGERHVYLGSRLGDSALLLVNKSVRGAKPPSAAATAAANLLKSLEGENAGGGAGGMDVDGGSASGGRA